MHAVQELNSLSETFCEKYANVKRTFFSRDPEIWPVFAVPEFADIIEFRKLALKPAARLAKYPDGRSLFQQLKSNSNVPQQSSDPRSELDPQLGFVAALSKDWENPSSVENVITMPCDPAIHGAMMATMANPNLVYSEYSGMADELEKCVVRQFATLSGYDPETSTGLFTQGGTFCNLYGYLLGIRKSLPLARTRGMGIDQDYRIINSQGGHYSNTTNLSLLGIDIRKKTIRIKINDNNDIDLEDLRLQLTSCFSLNCTVPTIMLTLGTTDTFGLDRIKPVHDLRNQLCEEFEVKVKPHIHVDAAVGWPLVFFLNYDFDNNPLGINTSTLEGLRRNVSRAAELKYSDSFTVDFQKWGYVPYTSSLVMIRNREDLDVMTNDPENFSYFENDIQGDNHLQATIECSRSATGVFGAYSAMHYMGVEGYQTVLAHCLQNANYFRQRLSELSNVKVLAADNQGPSVSFKMYDPDLVLDPDNEFETELNGTALPDYQDRIKRNSDWHRAIFLQRGKCGLFTNWIEAAARSRYDERGRYFYIPGEKAVFMNPNTTRREIDQFIENIAAGVPL